MKILIGLILVLSLNGCAVIGAGLKGMGDGFTSSSRRGQQQPDYAICQANSAGGNTQVYCY